MLDWFPILLTKWYRIVITGIKIFFASCRSDAKTFSLSACRIARSIESELPISPSSSAGSDENCAFASTSLWLSAPRSFRQESCWFQLEFWPPQEASWRNRAWFIQGPFWPLTCGRRELVKCVEKSWWCCHELDEDSQKWHMRLKTRRVFAHIGWIVWAFAGHWDAKGEVIHPIIVFETALISHFIVELCGQWRGHHLPKPLRGRGVKWCHNGDTYTSVRKGGHVWNTDHERNSALGSIRGLISKSNGEFWYPSFDINEFFPREPEFFRYRMAG
jgi:hypothetical protein